MSEPVRLNKYLAHTLGLSRRSADIEISAGRVLVNNQQARIGQVVDPARDTISHNAAPISPKKKRYTYVLLNKPIGYVCSRRKQGESPTIYELLPRQYQPLKVAGRLDKDSCGLVLLTDDGDAIFKLTHPKFAKQKVYRVALNKPLAADDMAHLNAGVHLEDGTSKLEVTTLKKQSDLRIPNLLTVVMHEGRNRQIRRTFKQLGYTVTHLERTKLGPHQLSELNSSQYLQI